MNQHLLNSEMKEKFWFTITSCLVLLFNIEKDVAVDLTLELMERIEKPSDGGQPNELFYHAEPFDVAKDLAQKPHEDFEKHRQEYHKIIQAVDNKTLILA